MKTKGIWYYDEIDTPVGPLLLSMLDHDAIRIDYGTFTAKQSFLEKWAERYIDVTEWKRDPEHVRPMKKELNEYFAGKRKQFSFPYTLYGTPFQKAVWLYLIEQIPYGQIRTYKDVAEEVQRPKAFRAVGGAVNRNPFSIVIPCHRVVGSSGALVGYAGGLDKKKYILDLEGIK